MTITCEWLPEWLGYLAKATSTDGTWQFSRLLKGKDSLPKFIDDAELAFKKDMK